MRRAVVLAAVVSCAIAAASAGEARTTDGSATVLAAASLTEALPKVDGAARASFGGSNQLAQQARQGFPFDVFLSASPQYTQALFAEGLVRKPVAFATNSLVLIVPRRNPARIRSVNDLARRAKLRLVVAGPKVPIGLYTREVLKRLSLLQGAAEDRQPRARRQGDRGEGRARRGRRRVRLRDGRPARGDQGPGDPVPAARTADGGLRGGDRSAAA